MKLILKYKQEYISLSIYYITFKILGTELSGKCKACEKKLVNLC